MAGAQLAAAYGGGLQGGLQVPAAGACTLVHMYTGTRVHWYTCTLAHVYTDI